MKERRGRRRRKGGQERREGIFEDDICHAYLMYDCVEEVCEDCAAIHHFP